MTVEDLRGSDGDLEFETDLCIVGSGPADLSIASEFANSRVRVLIVESGDLKEEDEIHELNPFKNVDAPRHMALRKIRNRLFSGSFYGWGDFLQAGPSTSNGFLP
jgi:choline dehydrogenase-like flavoprotein